MNPKIMLSQRGLVRKCQIHAFRPVLLADIMVNSIMFPKIITISIERELDLASFGVASLLALLFAQLTLVVLLVIVLV